MESHLRSLAEHYRQDLSFLLLKTNRANAIFTELKHDIAVLLYNVDQRSLSAEDARL